MNQNSEINDDLRPEYDFTQMTVVARGQGRLKQTMTANLDFDAVKLVTNSNPMEEDLQKSRREIYQEYRRDILKRQLSNTENLDRQILTLSSSILGITITFIKNVVPVDKAILVPLLIASWGLLTFAIISTLISFHVSQKGLSQQLLFAEKYYLEECEEYGIKKNRFASLTELASYLSTGAFTLAVICLVMFISFNI